MRICLFFLAATLFIGINGCAYSPTSSSTSLKKSVPVIRENAHANKQPEIKRTEESTVSVGKAYPTRVYDAPMGVTFEEVDEQTVRIKRQPIAVTRLLDSADKEMSAANYVVAAAQVERALRVQPQSSLAYQKLAEIRLLQGKLGVAEQLARRALSLVPKTGMESIQQKKALWTLLADIRSAQGDDYGAERALEKAKSFW